MCVGLGVYGLAVELRDVLAAVVEGCEGALEHSDTWCTLGRPSGEETRGGVKLLLPGRALGGLSASSSALSIFICVTQGDSRVGLKSVFSALMFSAVDSCLMMCCFSSAPSSRASSSSGS